MWEFRVMRYLDSNDGVVEWASEELIIPYLSPIDGRMHRYFPDFVVKMKDRDGKITTRILEVKPLAQTKPPEVRKNGSRITKKYLAEVQRWGINSRKFAAADEFCKDRGWSFHLLTEKELGIK